MKRIQQVFEQIQPSATLRELSGNIKKLFGVMKRQGLHPSQILLKRRAIRVTPMQHARAAKMLGIVPFPSPRRIAVKAIDFRGNEVVRGVH